MDRITDHPDMTSAVYRGRKASTQTKLAIKQNNDYLTKDEQYDMSLVKTKSVF